MATDELGADLAAFAAEPFESTDPSVPLPPPEDADAANRILRRLRSHHARREELLDRYQAEADMLTAWRDDRLAGIDAQIDRLALSLEGWMRSRSDEAGVATEHLPAGELWLRTGRSSVMVTDEQAAFEWAVAHDVNVRVRSEVDKRALADVIHPGPLLDAAPHDPPGYDYAVALTADAEVVPGVVLRRPSRPAFTVHPYKENHDES